MENTQFEHFLNNIGIAEYSLIDLRDFTLEQAFLIFDTLQKNNHCHYIHVQHLKDQHIEKFAQLIRSNPCFKYLSSYEMKISDAKFVILAHALKEHKTLECISFAANIIDGNHLGASSAKEIVNVVLANKNIKSLQFANNQIGIDGALHFANLIKANTGLKNLCLYNNQIGDASAIEIAKALRNNTQLKDLDISINGITSACLTSFEEALASNNSLRLLNLSFNHIGGCGEKISNILLVNNSLQYLMLRFGELTKQDAIKIFDALRFNTSLIHIQISGNPIDDENIINDIYWQLSKNQELADKLNENCFLTKEEILNILNEKKSKESSPPCLSSDIAKKIADNKVDTIKFEGLSLLDFSGCYIKDQLKKDSVSLSSDKHPLPEELKTLFTTEGKGNYKKFSIFNNPYGDIAKQNNESMKEQKNIVWRIGSNG